MFGTWFYGQVLAHSLDDSIGGCIKFPLAHEKQSVF